MEVAVLFISLLAFALTGGLALTYALYLWRQPAINHSDREGENLQSILAGAFGHWATIGVVTYASFDMIVNRGSDSLEFGSLTYFVMMSVGLSLAVFVWDAKRRSPVLFGIYEMIFGFITMNVGYYALDRDQIVASALGFIGGSLLFSDGLNRIKA